MWSGLNALESSAHILRLLLLVFIGLANLAVTAGLAASLPYLYGQSLLAIAQSLMMQVPQSLWMAAGAFLGLIVVATLIWTWLAWQTLHALGTEGLRFSPSGAVGSYFVPLANLYLPFKAMRELVNRSLGEDEFQADSTVDEVTAWWACSVGAFLIHAWQLGIVKFNSLGPIRIVAPPAIELLMWCLGVVLTLASAFLMWQLVGTITRAQRELAGSRGLSGLD